MFVWVTLIPLFSVIVSGAKSMPMRNGEFDRMETRRVPDAGVPEKSGIAAGRS
jgi:hypothetical protein